LPFEENAISDWAKSKYLRTLADLKNQGLYQQGDKALKQIMAPDGDGLEETIDELTRGCLI